MNQTHSTANQPEHKRGQHLSAEERDAIQVLKRQSLGN